MSKSRDDRADAVFRQAVDGLEFSTLPEDANDGRPKTLKQMQVIFHAYRKAFPGVIIVDASHMRFNVWAEKFQPKTWDGKTKRFVHLLDGPVLCLRNGGMIAMMSAKLWNQFIKWAEEKQ